MPTRVKPAVAVPEPVVPPDLRKALNAVPGAKARWNDITPLARRDWIAWLNTVKQAETRKKRVERACDMLISGKRRPCCFSIVPFDLFKALGDMPPAKKGWATLDAVERRDLCDWVESAKDKSIRAKRIENVCAKLATKGAGKLSKSRGA
jgi:uncharacterized protein YdeI (YjbR/CyaY-like superfamily)